MFVIDRERAFVGSMNFDQRSLRINTEMGLIIDSPQIAREIAGRFDAITQPANSYQLILESADGAAGPSLRWVGVKDGNAVKLDTEPGVKPLKRTGSTRFRCCRSTAFCSSRASPPHARGAARQSAMSAARARSPRLTERKFSLSGSIASRSVAWTACAFALL